MLTLYHAPQSRSDSIVTLIDLMDIRDKVEITTVTIPRQDGSGSVDPRNPHPEGKVPYLVAGHDHVRERGAIIAYLTDRFPECGLGRPVGHPQRGAYLSWLFYYQGVIEPVTLLHYLKIEHPALQATFRDHGTMLQRLEEALAEEPFLLGQHFSAADLLCASPFLFFGEGMPVTPTVKDWVARCGERMPKD
ncbi:glutathione S-transferase family protein [Paracoccus benzoatiresistens]|uniref:Glutathione S-transferase N-terminal domain-containing protein n=1 Tax=Paracoccus benzoatiresistens TaxID=2997341 RepID=A0ABT4J4F3_9RHOB|nr:glutathione binding-like protein [Paracoccus sp. EF6]MCZ0962002.1 glutathione S-transferase N-terminal domain-containing protein [Paracoccus sp. EF6]